MQGIRRVFNVLGGAVGAVIVLLILTQDFQIYPAGTFGKLRNIVSPRKDNPPNGMQAFFVTTEDGERIHVWYQPVENSPRTEKLVGIVVHGNGGTLLDFSVFQNWLRSIGVPSYSFDYRGYGESSGWPSEKGIYRDTDAVVAEILRRENIPAGNLVVIGYSLGSAPASRVVAERGARALMLFAPFSSLKDVIRDRPGYRFLAPFLWSNLPTAEYVSRIRDTCVVITHGATDGTVPVINTDRVERAYRGDRGVFTYISPTAHHNNILGATHEVITPPLEACLTRTECKNGSRERWRCPTEQGRGVGE